MTGFAVAAVLGLGPVGLCIAWGEISRRDIANICVGVAALLFAILSIGFLPVSQIFTRFAAGLLAGSFLYVLWRLNRVGGGDVKLATVLVPFVAPPLWGMGFVLVLIFSGLALVGLRLAQDTRPLPFGIPLILAVLTTQFL